MKISSTTHWLRYFRRRSMTILHIAVNLKLLSGQSGSRVQNCGHLVVFHKLWQYIIRCARVGQVYVPWWALHPSVQILHCQLKMRCAGAIQCYCWSTIWTVERSEKILKKFVPERGVVSSCFPSGISWDIFGNLKARFRECSNMHSSRKWSASILFT